MIPLFLTVCMYYRVLVYMPVCQLALAASRQDDLEEARQLAERRLADESEARRHAEKQRDAYAAAYIESLDSPGAAGAGSGAGRQGHGHGPADISARAGAINQKLEPPATAGPVAAAGSRPSPFKMLTSLFNE